MPPTLPCVDKRSLSTVSIALYLILIMHFTPSHTIGSRDKYIPSYLLSTCTVFFIIDILVVLSSSMLCRCAAPVMKLIPYGVFFALMDTFFIGATMVCVFDVHFINHPIWSHCHYSIRGPPSGDKGPIFPFSSIFRPLDWAL